MAGVAGAGVLALVMTACGAIGSDSAGSGGGKGAGSGKGTSKPSPATALPVESTARKATWTDRSAPHQLEVAPKRLARGTATDLEHVRLDEDLKGTVPYYLTIAGEAEGIDQCRGHVPNTRLEPDSTLTLCTVHLLPKGDRPAMVSFEGEGKGARTLTWRAR